jgi:putative copper resistance protein D
MLAALAYGGGADAPALEDPGAVVRWGLPVAKLLVNLGAAGMIGALVLACWALTPKQPEWNAALDVSAASAGVFTVAAGATGFFTFLQTTNVPLSLDDRFGATLGQFLTAIPLGQAWLATTLIGAGVTVLAFGVRNQTALIFVTVIAIAALVPMAQQGHAAGTAGHNEAIIGLGVHIIFAAVWIGGLLTIVLLQRTLTTDRLLAVLGRYSTVALISFICVAASGYVSAALRIGTLDKLLTPYGVLVVGKVAALLALGCFGVLQRRWVIGRLGQARAAGVSGNGWFWGLVVSELAFMGIAAGLAAALARTATPVAETPPTTGSPAELLTGTPLPVPFTADRYITAWSFDLLWVLACAFAIFFYLAGVWRLSRRGDTWPVYRTVLWVAGIVMLFWITNGAVNLYGPYLFSAHMLAHMSLTMAVPVLLVPGAPITLLMRAVKPRKDGSRGGREWVLLAVHSRFARVVANPIVAAVLFAGSLWVFYFTPIFSWATTDHLGHEWMNIHFLITGYLFVQSIIGIDPVPYRLPHPFRLLLLLLTMAFHAFFGLAIMSQTGLLLADWYGAMGWGTDAIIDQQLGGGIAWSVGEIPTVALAIAVAVQWAGADARETKRSDRNADRTGEAELEAYNARLARLAEHDGAAR